MGNQEPRGTAAHPLSRVDTHEAELDVDRPAWRRSTRLEIGPVLARSQHQLALLLGEAMALIALSVAFRKLHAGSRPGAAGGDGGCHISSRAVPVLRASLASSAAEAALKRAVMSRYGVADRACREDF